jgi:lipid-binding SYLF domain-containing protein
VKTSTGRLKLALATLLVTLTPLAAHAQKHPEASVAESIEVLSEVTRNPKTGMPRLVLRKAEGIAIIPDMFKVSFIFGARFGRGVLVVRQPDGTWSNPLFIQLLGGSFGAQAGAQSTDLVLVFQSQKGLDQFLKGNDKLTIGVDVGAAAGPVGKRFEASTDAALKAEILSYSNTHGIFAGVSAEGGTLQIDWRANMLYYGHPVSPAAILAVNSPLPVPKSTIALQQMLAEKTAWPEYIVKGKRLRNPPVIMDDDSFDSDDPDGIQIDGALGREAPPASARRPNPATERGPKPSAEPGPDNDLDSVPPLSGRQKAPRVTKPENSNDEDLPEAMPEPAAPKAKSERKPRSKSTADDDEPELESPKSSGSNRSGI